MLKFKQLVEMQCLKPSQFLEEKSNFNKPPHLSNADELSKQEQFYCNIAAVDEAEKNTWMLMMTPMLQKVSHKIFPQLRSSTHSTTISIPQLQFRTTSQIKLWSIITKRNEQSWASPQVSPQVRKSAIAD